MTAKDKISYTIGLINTARQIAPKGSVCWIDHTAMNKNILSPIELHSILKKLEQDEGIIEVTDSPFSNQIKFWNPENINSKAFELIVNPKFDEYLMSAN